MLSFSVHLVVLPVVDVHVVFIMTVVFIYCYCLSIRSSLYPESHRSRSDHMVVGFITTYALNSYNQ
jgi:hypothetical protein